MLADDLGGQVGRYASVLMTLGLRELYFDGHPHTADGYLQQLLLLGEIQFGQHDVEVDLGEEGCRAFDFEALAILSNKTKSGMGEEQKLFSLNKILPSGCSPSS